MRRPAPHFLVHAALVALLLLGTVGCGGDEPILNAVGSYSDVAVLTDLSLLLPVAQELERVLEEPVEYSLKPEPMLKVEIFDMRDRKLAGVYKNVIVVGFFQGRDRASQEIRRKLGGESMHGMSGRELFVAHRADIYSKNQNVVFLAGADRNLMLSSLARDGAALRGQIELSNRERLRGWLFRDGGQPEVEAEIAEKGGFRLRVPTDYNPTRMYRGEDRGAMEIAATQPTRTVSVIWQEVDGPEILEDQEALLALRREWGAAYLEERLQDMGGFTWFRELFLGEEHPMLAGFWEAAEGDYGGPFRTIFHYDPRTKRLYGVNFLCYAPKLDKHGYMREAHAIAETFLPRP